MGILELLTIIFVALKLSNVIDWSWFFVLLPLLVALAFYCIVAIVNIFVIPVINIRNMQKELDRIENERIERKNKRF